MAEQPSSSPLVWLVLAVLALGAGGIFLLRGPTPPAAPNAISVTEAAPGAKPATGALRIAVIPKGTTHEFWKTIHAGAIKAERELTAAGTPVSIIWKGPLKEDDRSSQIDVVQTFIGQGVNAMVLAPLDRTALVAPVELAIGAKIPVVVIDSGLESDKQSCFIATNNLAGGKMGGKRLGEVMGGSGKVLMLRYQEGSASTEQREAGFLAAIKDFPGIQVISSDQYAGPTRATALTASQNLLNRYKAEISGVFCPNESSATGMLLALKELGLNGKLKFVAFDASDVLLTGLRDKDILGLVVQDPFNMGYLGVKNAVAAIKGEKIAKQIDTPVKLVTPDNINEPEIKALITPPLAEFLGEPARP
jgi:ribose transport system substrate-binding protein